MYDLNQTQDVDRLLKDLNNCGNRIKRAKATAEAKTAEAMTLVIKAKSI